MMTMQQPKVFGALVAALVLAGCGRGAFPGSTLPGGAEAQAKRVALAAALGSGLPGLSEADGTNLPIIVPPTPSRPAPTPTSGNAAELSVGTAQTMPAIKAFISSAQRTLWIEMFEFGGTYATILVPLLLERAKAGVKIKLLIDQAGSGSNKKGLKPYLDELKAAGIDVRYYKAGLRRDGDVFRFNITHRKLLLADEQVGMAGGTNFGTTFENTTHDLMVKWRGPVVQDLYREFVTEWRFVGGGQLPVPPAPPAAGSVDARVAVTSVPEGRFEIRDAVYKAIENAKEEVLVEQQYIYEDGLERRLADAAKRGVKVRVMIPGGTKENVVINAMNMDSLNRLAKLGVEARSYRDPAVPVAHLHVKYFSVDNNWVATGSCNGDARSLVDHQELDVLTTSPAFVAEVKQRLFEADWARAGQVFVYKKVPWYKKPLNSLLELVDYLF